MTATHNIANMKNSNRIIYCRIKLCNTRDIDGSIRIIQPMLKWRRKKNRVDTRTRKTRLFMNFIIVTHTYYLRANIWRSTFTNRGRKFPLPLLAPGAWYKNSQLNLMNVKMIQVRNKKGKKLLILQNSFFNCVHSYLAPFSAPEHYPRIRYRSSRSRSRPKPRLQEV